LKLHGLSSKERIKTQKDIDKIYSSGSIIISEDQKIKAIFVVDKKAQEGGIKIATAVSKKHGKAVWRNRVKRLIRESYRLNKQKLIDICEETNTLLMIIFSAFSITEQTNRKVTIEDLMPGVVEIMRRMEKSIL
jgi:ribonuclease P protein component